VGDPDHDNFLRRVVYYITYAPVANSNSPDVLFALNLETAGGAGIIC
jgi:hypothetical protein